MPKVTSIDNYGDHVSALAFFTVSDEKLKEYETRLSDYLKITKDGTLKTGQSLYYGFGKCGNTFVVREGYKTVKDFFAHLAEIKEVQDFAGEALMIIYIVGFNVQKFYFFIHFGHQNINIPKSIDYIHRLENRCVLRHISNMKIQSWTVLGSQGCREKKSKLP